NRASCAKKRGLRKSSLLGRTPAFTARAKPAVRRTAARTLVASAPTMAGTPHPRPSPRRARARPRGRTSTAPARASSARPASRAAVLTDGLGCPRGGGRPLVGGPWPGAAAGQRGEAETQQAEPLHGGCPRNVAVRAANLPRKTAEGHPQVRSARGDVRVSAAG